MSQRQRNVKLAGLSKSLSRSKFGKSCNNSLINQKSFIRQHKSKSLQLKKKNSTKSYFISKDWNKESFQTAYEPNCYSQKQKFSPQQKNQLSIMNKIRALEQASPLQTINPLKEKILSQQIKRSIQYKNMEVSKLLNDLHHFFVCIQEVKWILHTSHNLMKNYNFQISNFYKQYFKVFKRKEQIESLVNETSQLIKRFDSLGQIHTRQNIFSIFDKKNDCFISHQKDQNSYFINTNKNDILNINKSNQKEEIQIEEKQSIQKYLQELNKHKIVQNHLNQDFKTKTFNITQQNSPFKNKTLSQLIKLSERRRDSQFKSKEKAQNQKQNYNYLNQVQNQNQEQSRQISFNKNKKISLNKFSKLQKMQKNPFQNIQILAQQSKTEKDSKIIQLQETIRNLKKQIQCLTSRLQSESYNSKILHTLQQQKQQMICQNKLSQQRFQNIKSYYLNYQVYIKKMTEKAKSLLKKILGQNQKKLQLFNGVSSSQNVLTTRSLQIIKPNNNYFNQLFKILQSISCLNENMPNLSIQLMPQTQQIMKDKKYNMQKELIQVQFQISELKATKQELNKWIQFNNFQIAKKQTQKKQLNLIQEDKLRFLYAQSKTIEDILNQQQ